MLQLLPQDVSNAGTDQTQQRQLLTLFALTTTCTQITYHSIVDIKWSTSDNIITSTSDSVAATETCLLRTAFK